MDANAKIKLKADVGRIIDGEAWKAMEDGRASLEGSLWHLRQGWALEKAEQIIALVMSDSGTKRTLEHWRQEVGKLYSQLAAKDAELSRLREALQKIADFTARCDHDGGFDREIGPIGCNLGDKCLCIGIHPIARTALNESREGE